MWHLPPASPNGAKTEDGSVDGPADDASNGGSNGGGEPPSPASISKLSMANCRFTVRAVDFDVEHVVSAGSLRPPYAWRADAKSWSLRPPPGVYIQDGKAPGGKGGAVKKKAPKKPKAAPAAGARAAAPQPGEPSVPANQFTVGTKRKGTDGRVWEVDLKLKSNVWVVDNSAGNQRSRKRGAESAPFAEGGGWMPVGAAPPPAPPPLAADET